MGLHPPDAPEPSPACALAQQAALGDAQAFEALIAPFKERLLNLLRSMVRTAADAEEVLQQALLQMHLGLPRLKPPKNDSMLSAWIFRVAVNAGLMHLRANRRRPVLHLDDVGQHAVGHAARRSFDGSAMANRPLWPVSYPLDQPDQKLLREELTAQLRLAIDALPDKYRLVLWLRDIEEQSNDEVAQTLGLTVPTVKARLLRARAVVRGALKTYVA